MHTPALTHIYAHNVYIIHLYANIDLLYAMKDGNMIHEVNGFN